MSVLPRVLAGPLVRRIEPRAASFFIATSEKARVRAHLWRGATLLAGPGPAQSAAGNPLASGDFVETRRFGKQLWVAVVTVHFELGGGAVLQPSTVYSYNLELDFGAGGVTDLAGEGLLRDEVAEDRPQNRVDPAAPRHLALGYDPGVLPSFITLPATPGDLRLAHTSCRKAHGPGYDALAWLDDVIARTRTSAEERPQLLCLTGDQIYADDVAACLLPVVNTLGHDLLGRDEPIPTTVGNFDGSIANFPALRRQKLINNDAHLTSQEGACHLLTFCEFAAMYLLAFSPRPWRALATADDVFVGLGELGTAQSLQSRLTNWEAAKGDTGAWRRGFQNEFDEQTRNIEAFRRGVPHVARALANVATYMILDDHEVTDDWNLNGRWVDRVYTTSLGKRLIANAVLAYGVFQAWGNEPHAFVPRPALATIRLINDKRLELVFSAAAPPGAVGDRVALTPSGQGGKVDGSIVAMDGNVAIVELPQVGLFNVNEEVSVTVSNNNGDLLTEAVAHTADADDGAVPPVEPTARLANLCGFGADLGHRLRFHFTVAFSSYVIAFLDSRTRRTMPDRMYSPANLLGDSLGAQVPAPARDGELLIVISPAPVLGPGTFERSLQPATMVLFDAKAYCFDVLAAGEKDGTSSGPRLTAAEVFDAEGWAMNEAAQAALLLRLAAHKRVVILSGDVHYGCSLDIEYWRKGLDTSPDRIAQFTSSPAHNGFMSVIQAVARRNGSLQKFAAGQVAARLYWIKKATLELPAGAKVAPGRRARLAHEPAILPGSGWPAGITIPADKAPDGSWIVKLVRDERTEAQAPPALAQPGLGGPDVSAGDPLAGYASVVNRHGVAAMNQFDQLRQLVFSSNIGLVRIERDGAAGPFRAVHTLLSRRGLAEPDASEPAENTVHIVSLAPSGAKPPMRA